MYSPIFNMKISAITRSKRILILIILILWRNFGYLTFYTNCILGHMPIYMRIHLCRKTFKPSGATHKSIRIVISNLFNIPFETFKRVLCHVLKLSKHLGIWIIMIKQKNCAAYKNISLNITHSLHVHIYVLILIKCRKEISTSSIITFFKIFLLLLACINSSTSLLQCNTL